MKNTYTAPWRKLALTALLGLGGAAAAQAQFLNYPPALAVNTTGTYTDLGTNGTAIAVIDTDDDLSAPQNIGFTFNYNGTAFTQFVLSTNGFIKLGSVTPSSNLLLNPIGSANPADTDIIAAISNMDLYGAANQTTNPTEFRVATTGTAPNRVCTIQFENLRDYATATVPAQFATMQFQIRLFEGTNNIELVYGAWTATAGTPTGQPAVIGLKGTTNTAADWVLALKPSSASPWSSTTFDKPAALSAHFIRNAFLPDAGRTYRFVAGPPLPANDASVQIIYSLGKVPAASPQVVQAVVRNSGSAALTNVPVTLNVTGANTFTDAKIVPSLAPGATATVSFAAYTPATLGNNTLTVTVPADAVTTNNSKTYAQAVTAGTYSVADPSQTATGGGVGFTANGGTSAGSGIFAVKYTANVARTVSSVNVQLEGAPASVGRTVYAVVLDAAGAILGRTADYVIQTSDIGSYKTFTFTTPVAVPAGEFYAGFAQAASPTGTAPFFPLGLQTELPTRTGTFYTTVLAGGTPAEAAASNLGRFMIEAATTTVQGTSEALNRAVSLYPNPSTGLVKLQLTGANAKGSLQVSVLNMLGQTVHTASLKDNFTNEVNLSSLANGVYLLKVQTGADFTIRQLTIAK